MARAGWVMMLALACSAASGCPDDDDDDDAAIAIGSPGSSADPCDEWKAWKLRCVPDASADDLDYYDECRMLHWNKVEPAFTRAMAQCFPMLACDLSDDHCSAMGFDAVGVTEQSANQDMLVKVCLGAIEGCGFGDDVCFELTVLTSAARAEARACSTASCESYDTCMRAILGEPDRKRD